MPAKLPKDSKTHRCLPLWKGVSGESGEVSLKHLAMSCFNAHLHLYLWKMHFMELSNASKLKKN